jgi:hypothetical protein
MNMNTNHRRLDRLAERFHLTDPQSLDPVDIAAYRLCDGVALLQAARQMAQSRAQRRAMNEGRWPVTGFNPPEFPELVQVEFADLRDLWLEAGELWQPIERWSDEPDELDWPVPRSYSDRPQPSGYAAFLEWLDLLRVRFDQQRAATADGSIRWRAAHPDWRRGMEREESVAWDLARILEGGQPDDR